MTAELMNPAVIMSIRSLEMHETGGRWLPHGPQSQSETRILC